MAYQAMELKDAANALLLAHDVLRIDPHYAAAHRLLGLLEWQSPKVLPTVTCISSLGLSV